MAALSESRVGVIRTLIETAPDSAIKSLDLALKGEGGVGSLSMVKAILDREVRDRAVRDAVFAPLVPLFAPRDDGLDQLRFPAGALSRLWRVLKTAHPDETHQAAAAPPRQTPDEVDPPIYDQICQLAAQGLRGDEAFHGVMQMLQSFRPGADAQLIGYLDLAPLARQALQHVPSWMARMNDERAAIIRLMFKDAADIADDAGPRLMEILFAHLTEPWTILRVISGLMFKPDDRYASASELADFGARLLKEVDLRVELVKIFDSSQGAEGGFNAAEALRVCAAVVAEFEQSLNIDRSGPWGERLAKQKQTLAALAEGHLRKVDKVVADALPLQPVRIGGRIIRTEPRLDAPPDEPSVRRAKAMLAFFEKVRGPAALGGYGTLRAKVLEDVSHRLDGYVEELLAMIHSGENDCLDNARAYLETIADFAGMVHDERAAQVIRRRAAAA